MTDYKTFKEQKGIDFNELLYMINKELDKIEEVQKEQLMYFHRIKDEIINPEGISIVDNANEGIEANSRFMDSILWIKNVIS